jgi:hypothetical protein
MRAFVCILVVLIGAVFCGCSGRGSAARRIASCEHGMLSGMESKSAQTGWTVYAGIAQSAEGRATADAYCHAADADGVLSYQGNASTADTVAVLTRHPESMSPVCRFAFKAGGYGRIPGSLDRYLPDGGVEALADRYCANLVPYISGMLQIDRRRLFADRGAQVAVPLCIAGLLRESACRDYPFSVTDQRLLFNRLCTVAWNRDCSEHSTLPRPRGCGHCSARPRLRWYAPGRSPPARRSRLRHLHQRLTALHNPHRYESRAGSS